MLQVWEGELDLPRPFMNREVLDLSGRVIAVVDLLDVESGTYGEYNGALHRSRERQRRDEARADALRRVGLEGFVLVAGDSERVWRDRMLSARGRALWLPEDRRQWRVGACRGAKLGHRGAFALVCWAGWGDFAPEALPPGRAGGCG